MLLIKKNKQNNNNWDFSHQPYNIPIRLTVHEDKITSDDYVIHSNKTEQLDINLDTIIQAIENFIDTTLTITQDPFWYPF
jgi:hypothetical protein